MKAKKGFLAGKKTLNAREIHKECKVGFKPEAYEYIVYRINNYVNM